MNDKSQSPVRRDIAANPGQPGHVAGRGGEDGSRIQHVESAWYSDLMPEILTDGTPQQASSQFLAPQHALFNAPAYGGIRSNSMDDVDRSGNVTGGDLGIEVLESKFMGVDSDTPEVVASKPGQQMRNIPRPHGAPSGSWATDGRKHPLNAGDEEPMRHNRNRG
jgi:hypothetical protein